MGDGPRFSSAEHGFLRDMRERWEQRARVDFRFFTATKSRDEAEWASHADGEAAWFLRGLDPDRLSNQVLLDVGCGPARLLARLAPAFRIAIGVDISATMLAHARHETRDHPNVDVVRSGGHGLEFLRDGTAHCVVMHAAAIHMPLDLIRRYFREVHRVLAPSGRFRCTVNRLTDTVDDRAEASSLAEEAICRAPEGGEELVHEQDYGGHSFTEPELAALLDASGFAPVVVERVGPLTLAVDATRP